MNQTTSRRTLLQVAGLGTAGLILPVTGPAHAAPGGRHDRVLAYVNHHARPLRSLAPTTSWADLNGLRSLCRRASIVGLGESAHGTHTELTLKHRVAQFLVERMGFRTIAWEESWGAGVAIDRYVTSGEGDPESVVKDAMFMLQSKAMLDLVRWMRQFNIGRPRRDQVRFLGAEVLELRPVQFEEIERFISDVAPRELPALHRHLDPIALRGAPFEQRGWFVGLSEREQAAVVAHAHAVLRLVRRLPSSDSTVSAEDARQHAHAILGYYESLSDPENGDDLRDLYATQIINAWRGRTHDRMIYSAANAHTAATPRVTVSFPDGQPGDDIRVREMAGGRLRRQYGQRYVSIGTIFNNGGVLTGWEDYPPDVYHLPAPHPSFVDHILGQADAPDYLLDLHHHAPPPVRAWLWGPARMRILSSAYYPENDADYRIEVDPWRRAFDAILHINHVEPTQLLQV